MCRGLAILPATCNESAKNIKHKISSLLQKPDPETADQMKTKAQADAAADSMPTPDEVKKWKESFSHVMSSPMGRTVFANFLKSEFSEENMDFWVACEIYKMSTPSKMATRAKKLYQQHVEADAPNEVNLDARTREKTRQNLENACPCCFNDAQKIIYTLMEKDSYRRFINSKMIQDLNPTESAAAQEKKKKKKEEKNCDCAQLATPKQQANRKEQKKGAKH